MTSEELNQHTQTIYWGIITVIIVNAVFTGIVLFGQNRIQKQLDLIMNHFDIHQVEE